MMLSRTSGLQMVYAFVSKRLYRCPKTVSKLVTFVWKPETKDQKRAVFFFQPMEEFSRNENSWTNSSSPRDASQWCLDGFDLDHRGDASSVWTNGLVHQEFARGYDHCRIPRCVTKYVARVGTQ